MILIIWHLYEQAYMQDRLSNLSSRKLENMHYRLSQWILAWHRLQAALK
jgi:hypothetical protein